MELNVKLTVWNVLFTSPMLLIPLLHHLYDDTTAVCFLLQILVIQLVCKLGKNIGLVFTLFYIVMGYFFIVMR